MKGVTIRDDICTGDVNVLDLRGAVLPDGLCRVVMLCRAAGRGVQGSGWAAAMGAFGNV